MYEGLCDTHSAHGHQHGRPLPELAPDDSLQTTTPRSLCHGPLLQVIHIIYIIYIQIYDTSWITRLRQVAVLRR